MRKRVLAPGQCPSVTLVHCIQTAKYAVKLLCWPGSPVILVSGGGGHPLLPIPRRTYSARALNTWEWKISRFLTKIEMVRDRPEVAMER